ncbi:ac17 [Hemileuca sp. nucleopolyhedrovirus]|uniref:Ac17 n=1 Tax=Hemileuca sp. nucleopolyhedrovirus TaxID=1367203 RepID=S5MQD9_9ABAC|nr:ac17 [Hemileuca sp. nucleopolyhedrovirus]AGR56883.1 ac17 [Hemileuca sp. nucleopolyhedrovirus]
MLRVTQHPVTVYFDGVASDPVLVQGDYVNRKIIMKFVINEYNNRCVINPKIRVGVKVESNNKYIQATFASPPRHVCIVNAIDARMPCMFDGFPNDEDESQTVPFYLSKLNPLNDNNGLINVKEIAKAMESNVLLKIFVNEASICDKLKYKKWYNRLWFKNVITTQDNREKNGNDDVIFVDHEMQLISELLYINKRASTNFANNYICYNHQDHYNNKNKDITSSNIWAPVECKTGPLLLTIDLIFEFKN